MNLSPRHLIKLLEENGFMYKRSKGSHRLYYNPINNKTAIVPFHGGRDLVVSAGSSAEGGDPAA